MTSQRVAFLSIKGRRHQEFVDYRALENVKGRPAYPRDELGAEQIRHSIVR